MILFVLVNTIDRIRRNRPDALGTDVLAARRMGVRGGPCLRELVLIFANKLTSIALIGHLATVQANKALGRLHETSALRDGSLTVLIIYLLKI
jgi:hypothetical protein